MAIVTGDRYLEKLVKFLEEEAEPLIEGTKVLKLNPTGLHYVHLRLEMLQELERMLSGAPVDYLRAYVSDLVDFRALEQLRRILRLLTSLKVVSSLPPPARDPTPLSLLPFERIRVLELRGCDLSASAAKGLLELRHTLEKIICHNSTDALRHVFASRIADVKDSPQWNKLSFVSCACNRLVLMDESLQLLPAVETLDLSRNKFAKVDNLRRCAKLKHLDLGFNHLRTVSHFSEVSCQIVKLVLRNNALTTLRGIENLKSLEGLDISYNIISNFSELEFLGSLTSLRSLWLEGNPLCCARWYRAHVFSYFVYPHNLKLDDKEMSTRESWKRQLIIARRQKRPASFGFYSPAKDDAEGEGSGNRKRKKFSRLASINSEEESTYVCSDQESASCDHEIQSKEDNVRSENEVEIVDLINKVENLKKERSILWLLEFKEWMDHPSEGFLDVSTYNWAIHTDKRNSTMMKKSERQYGESSRYVLGSIQASGDESNTNTFESDGSFANMSTSLQAGQYVNANGSLMPTGEISSRGTEVWGYQKASHEELVPPKKLHPETFVIQDQKTAENSNVLTLNTIDDAAGSHLSSAYPGSPPHYEKDVLHRRHNLVEEILQLSADSYSVASPDSMTSCSEDDIYDSEQSICEYDHFISGDSEDDAYQQNRLCLLASQSKNISSTMKTWHTDQSFKSDAANCLSGSNDAELTPSGHQNDDWFEKRKSRRKPKRRVVAFSEDKKIDTNGETSQKSDFGIGGLDAEEEGNDCCSKQIQDNAASTKIASPGMDDLVMNYFRKEVTDVRNQETCRLYVCCDCILEQNSTYKQREVVMLLSSENNLYVLLLGVPSDGPESSLSSLAKHRVEDVRDVSVGLGLQVVRIYIGEGTSYLFITKNIQKSTELLNVLQFFDSQAMQDKCFLRSLEQAQREIFEKRICGGLKLSIFQYAVLHFCCSTFGEESWLPRSLFLAGHYLFVCVEDFTQFNSLSEDAYSASYFVLDSCCSISDVSEMVIETRGGPCLSLAIKGVSPLFCSSIKPNKNPSPNDRRKKTAGSKTWKLKWFSEECLLKFASLLKALHGDAAARPLLVRQVD